MQKILSSNFLKELELEYAATRKCLERIPEKLFDYKPHPKSMELGYLAPLVAAIPSWITQMIEKDEIDFVTFPKPTIKTSEELLAYFEENIKGAKAALSNIDDEALQRDFSLKSNGETVYTAPKEEHVLTTLNHWVHHRGQLTVYMRLNEIPVPSIYGPSADEK